MQVWSGHLGQLVTSLEGEESDSPQRVCSVSFHPDGHEVAVGFHEGFAKVFHISTGARQLKRLGFILSLAMKSQD